MELRTNRNIPNIGRINEVLIECIAGAINDCDDAEFETILDGGRGSISLTQNGRGSFKVTEDSCAYGDLENIPCQWCVSRCNGAYCSHYENKHFVVPSPE